jgi:hypothetical protein
MYTASFVSFDAFFGFGPKPKKASKETKDAVYMEDH